MAFDDSTRARLREFVGDARALLTAECTRQLQHEYGMNPVTGEVVELSRLPVLDDTRRDTARLLRDTLTHYLATSPSGGRPEALQRIVREQAFTVLNRLVALRMMEARGLLLESIARGYQSRGFQLYQRLAGSSLGETGDAHHCYLASLFDEFALDLAVLFERFSAQGRLFPHESALLELLGLINHPEIEPLWAEDETIGWIYQYYNTQEERRQMRADSPAPRNSRELAVRNQFFTPRYVVEFLTDNTLGRLWYEMTQGQTTLTEQCRYLVRRPQEIFLQPGEEAPAQEEPHRDLSQEALLQQPVYIPFRALKDPRDIRMLDPACGSMHFGLYAFDLFEVIYDEAWELAHGSDEAQKSSASFASFVSFVAQYLDKAAFLADVPRLIIEHNLHGIDIDPRAVQIAGLSLWLCAQRTWQQQGLRPQNRPCIRRSNIVCAEPMPGEEAFLDEFIEAHLAATPEHRLLGQLVRRVFDAMKLAGEAGSLLKIEEEIAGAMAEAKQKWLADTRPEQGCLFADDTVPAVQKERGLDVTGITDETFWEQAEERIYTALQTYAEQAENGGGYQRRLFADDTARGFAFIDLCRKRYDVVVMNPPFGEPTEATRQQLKERFSIAADNVAISFMLRGEQMLLPSGLTSSITDCSWAKKYDYKEFRIEVLKNRNLRVLVHLGWEVLDNANVETNLHR
jgi:Eco57I restriction-modification methylase